MKRRTVVAYAAVAAVLTLAGCAGGDDTEQSLAGRADSDAAEAPDAAADEDDSNLAGGESTEEQGAAADDGAAGDGAGGGVLGSAQNQDVVLDREIIYTVELEVVTAEVADAARRTASIAQRAGGFIADEHASEDQATLTVRVPSSEHADVVSELEELGEVRDRSRSAQDVTEQVVDLESRISSQRESIARIRALLEEAEELADVIAIESELASREADLDALLSRREQLADLTDLATITVTFSAPDEEDDDENGTGLLAGLGIGWDAFLGAGTVLLTALGAVMPFLLITAPVAAAVWSWRIRRRQGTPPVTPASPQP